MEAILGEIGKALAGFFGSPVVQFVIYSIAVYLVVLWLASAYWVFRDMQQRTENAILPYLAASLVIVFLPVFPLAVFVYKIIRPHEKIGEVYERNLAEEALLAEVEAIKTCPTCARRVNDEWIICPTCRTRLNRVCPNCSRLVGLDWSLCAWCGKDFERPATAIGPSAGRPAQISPLPAGDEAGRIGRTAPPLEVESDRPAISRSMARPRAASPRSAAPRTAPDVLPEG
jgi:RNA polymerase subunit RPABC4/transcription elongation factor Spt4